MFAILVDLLAGRYVATAYNDRDCVEWPPHPARLFSALVATWADGEPESLEGAQERAALEWLETLDPPQILASSDEATALRTVTPIFVPVNDASILSEPDREKLDAATVALSQATEPKTRAKLEKEVIKLQQKLVSDTTKAIAEPLKVGKDDVAAALRLFPERRTKKARTFPSVTPEVPSVAFVWDSAQVSDAAREALGSLLSKSCRLGHSSTLIAARVIDEAAIEALALRTQRIVPDEERGDTLIRWVRPGQLRLLVEAFERHRETEPRVLPARFVRYRAEDLAVEVEPLSTVFDDDLVVLARVGGPRLPITSAAGLARQLRRALMADAEQPVTEMLSGHRADGSSSELPHLAIVPLPVVGSEYADGAILGMALALPRECPPSERRAVLRALGQLEKRYRTPEDDEAPTLLLELGESGSLELQRVVWGAPSRTLHPGRWSKASRRWATVTPIALDRNPGDLHDSNPERRRAAFTEAEAIVREAVRRVAPAAAAALVELDVVRSCVVSGTAKPRNYPRFPIDRGRPQRVLVHARLVFAQPLRGPLLLGAGRYQGLGLCLPVDDRQSEIREEES